MNPDDEPVSARELKLFVTEAEQVLIQQHGVTRELAGRFAATMSKAINGETRKAFEGMKIKEQTDVIDLPLPRDAFLILSEAFKCAFQNAIITHNIGKIAVPRFGGSFVC